MRENGEMSDEKIILKMARLIRQRQQVEKLTEQVRENRRGEPTIGLIVDDGEHAPMIELDLAVMVFGLRLIAEELETRIDEHRQQLRKELS